MDNKSVNRRIVIALDIALNKSGFVVMDEKGKVLYTKVVEPNKKFKYYKKLSYLFEAFQEVFTLVLEKYPEHSVTLAMEDRLKAGWGGNTLATIEGARVTAYHAYRIACANAGKEVIMELHDPNDLKLQFTGKRNAGKMEMKSASERYKSFDGIEYQEDIYDSIFLALRSLYGPDFKKP